MTNPNSLRERVAQAIEKSSWTDHHTYLPEADAALAVVQEWMVSEEVIVEAIKHGREEMNRLHFSDEGYENNDALWRGFMKAALQAAAKKMGGIE